MRHSLPATMVALTLLAGSLAFGAARLVPADVTVGQSLQTTAEVTLDQAAPTGGLPIRLTSNDPGRVLLSVAPEKTGAASITITVRAGLKGSPEFYVQGLGSSGVVTYTASADGYENGDGAVRLAPSGFVFAQARAGLPAFRTTTGAGALDLSIHSALLDSSLNYVGVQPVAGGVSASVTVTSSNPAVGRIAPLPLVFAEGSWNANLRFQPAAGGHARLAISAPPGFSVPAQFGALEATVSVPGMAVTDGVAIGENLQIDGIVSLGEPAPAGGVKVTLASNPGSQLLLSPTAAREGSNRITLTIPPGGASAKYYLQAHGNSGQATYTASAPGYLSRTGTITLAPSGVVIGGPQGPPDEAELLRKDAAEGPKGFVAILSARAGTPIAIYTVQLDPLTRRGADLTVQPLRASLTLTVKLDNAKPAVGTVPASLTIAGGASMAASEFTPLSPGATVISVVTPEGYSKSSNATSLTAIVKP